MRFRLAHIHDYNTFLAIDVGSYKVRATSYKIEESGVCQELSHAVIRQGRKNFMNGSIVDLRGVASSIEQAINAASRPIEHRIEDIIVGFSSEFFELDIITTQYMRADPSSTLTMEEIDVMIKKIEKQSFGNIEAKIEEKYGKNNTEIRLISSILSSIYIDGKKVNNPIGFTGKTIKLTICNIFLPVSEFNVMRSIVASLDKKTISIIPLPLVYTRILEDTDYSDGRTVFIDIGHSYLTFLQSTKSEIESFETHHLGFSILYGELSLKYGNITMIEIEKYIVDFIQDRTEFQMNHPDIYEDFMNFFIYIVDLLAIFIEKQTYIQLPRQIILNGSCFSGVMSINLFREIARERCAFEGNCYILGDIIKEKGTSRSIAPLNYGLSVIAQDLLLIKKDPFIRILRYILYQYE